MIEHVLQLGRLLATRELQIRVRDRLVKDLRAMGYNVSVTELDTLTTGMIEVIGDVTQKAVDLGKGVYRGATAKPRSIKNPMR